MLDRVRRRLAAHPDVARIWVSDPGTRRAYLVLAWLAVALAVNLAATPSTRFIADGWTVIRETGGTDTWMFVWAAGALALVLARTLGLRATYWALQIGGTVHLLWAFAFGLSAWQHGGASWLGCTLFTTFAVLHVSTALEHRAPAVVV